MTLPEAVAARCFHQLSAGERSLAELARSLCGNANVIAVDEALLNQICAHAAHACRLLSKVPSIAGLPRFACFWKWAWDFHRSDVLIWFGDDFDGDGKHQDCSSVSR